MYYKNGKIHVLIPIKNGMIDGVVLVYYPKGQLQNKVSYKDGMMDGKSFMYKKNGDLLTESEFCKGDQHGRYIFYATKKSKTIEFAENNYLVSDRVYMKGDKITSWDVLDFDEQGYVASVYINKQGEKIVNKFNTVFPSGYLTFVGIPVPDIFYEFPPRFIKSQCN